MIRSGEREASVRAEFSVLPDSDAAVRLGELDVETDGDIIITRRFTSDGKSSIKINGNAVTAAMLKSVTQLLVDVHGQSEHFYLLDAGNQLKVIDGLCGRESQCVREKLASLISEKKELKEKISELGGNARERERKLDLLSYQIDEIEKAQLHDGELEELNSRRLILNNAERIISATETVQSALNDDGGCIDAVSLAIRQLGAVAHVGDEYGELLDRLENLRTEAEDIASTAADLEDGLSFDEREAERVDERISFIKSLIKKYGSDEGEILAYCEKAKREYELLSEGAEAIERYTGKIEKLDDEIYGLCLNLTEIRRNAARDFCTRIEKELKTLNIPNARFTVDFKPYDRATANLSSRNGSDEICFLFSANKGEPLKPLGKVISGGEMSRFLLAGISGVTARTVAEKFIDIAKHTQILAVSHLPQVCAASDCQFLIYKTDIDGKTVTRVKRLDAEEKVQEIVRLTGSINSEAARTHAEELISQFKNR